MAALEFANSFGYAVIYPDMKLTFPHTDMMGGVNYRHRNLYINPKLVRAPKEHFFTVAHELGHIIAVARGAPIPHKSLKMGGRAHIQHERRAYLWGWAVIRLFGLQVSKKEWRHWHWEAKL